MTPKMTDDNDNGGKINLERAKRILRDGEAKKVENRSRWRRMRQKARDYVQSLKDGDDDE